MTAVSPLKEKDEKEKSLLDLENWMANLPDIVRNTSVIRIAIPGSHDSMTYSITRRSKISPDAEPSLKRWSWLNPIKELIMVRWTKTQQFDVTKQLKNGIRYFDLRVSTKPGSEDLFFVHGQYADNVKVPLGDLVKFLDEHPQETVLLDCQHFYAFKATDHKKFVSYLNETFNSKLVPYSGDMDHLTLNYMTQFKYQILIIYRHDAARSDPLLWPSQSFPTPWPDTLSVSVLISKLNERLKVRDFKCGLVSQCILTPTVGFVVKNCFGNLKKTCALPLEKPKLNWLLEQKPGTGGLNVVIADFVDMSQSEFCKVVIKLNDKLLTDT